MQPTELVGVMAAILYREREAKARKETMEQAQAAAVAEAWHVWHLTLEHWSDSSAPDVHEPSLPA